MPESLKAGSLNFSKAPVGGLKLSLSLDFCITDRHTGIGIGGLYMLPEKMGKNERLLFDHHYMLC